MKLTLLGLVSGVSISFLGWQWPPASCQVRQSMTQADAAAAAAYAAMYAATSAPDPDLKPERSKSYEGGLELRFLKDKLGFDVTCPVGKVKAFEHQVKQHIRQTRGQQHTGIQNNQRVATGGEWVAIHHLKSAIVGQCFNPLHHICLSA